MTRATVFPYFENAGLFDAIAARLAPFGFRDVSFTGLPCPTLEYITPDGVPVSVAVDGITARGFPALDPSRPVLIQLDGVDVGQFADAESSVAAALVTLHSIRADAFGMGFDFPILRDQSFARAAETIRDLNNAGLLWHMDESPDSIVTIIGGARLFTRQQCETLERVRDSLWAVNWGETFEDIHGYCLHVQGHWPLLGAESGDLDSFLAAHCARRGFPLDGPDAARVDMGAYLAHAFSGCRGEISPFDAADAVDSLLAAIFGSSLALPGFTYHATGGNCTALRAVQNGVEWLICTSGDGGQIPVAGAAGTLSAFDAESGDERGEWHLPPGGVTPGVVQYLMARHGGR